MIFCYNFHIICKRKYVKYCRIKCSWDYRHCFEDVFVGFKSMDYSQDTISRGRPIDFWVESSEGLSYLVWSLAPWHHYSPAAYLFWGSSLDWVVNPWWSYYEEIFILHWFWMPDHYFVWYISFFSEISLTIWNNCVSQYWDVILILFVYIGDASVHYFGNLLDIFSVFFFF